MMVQIMHVLIWEDCENHQIITVHTFSFHCLLHEAVVHVVLSITLLPCTCSELETSQGGRKTAGILLNFLLVKEFAFKKSSFINDKLSEQAYTLDLYVYVHVCMYVCTTVETPYKGNYWGQVISPLLRGSYFGVYFCFVFNTPSNDITEQI